jgi:sulfatase maturation enzyme AslB (radical SAM superfamily)
MNFEKTFCSSPWFHMRINNAGCYEYCRWSNTENRNSGPSINNVTPDEFFQQHMLPIRNSMLSGESIPGCSECYKMEQHGKISGRQRQLLKVGIQIDNFTKTTLSSPWFNQFNNTSDKLLPQDWQIDLGNFCNSACVFCDPTNSSRLAGEFKKLKIINKLPTDSWCNDPAKLDSFVATLKKSPVLKYLHFIGGETLITPAFKTILQALIDNELNKVVTIGFTTNLTVWDDEICNMLTKFQEVNLGLSIECFTILNDYVRWPSKIDTVTRLTESWLKLAQQHKWLVQFRTTPTILTVGKLLTVHDYAWQNNISVESCNFLEKPDFLRISVLPMQYRQPIIDQIKSWLASRCSTQSQVVNTRNPEFAKSQVVQDLTSYVNYLENEIDESHLLPKSMEYLKLLESNRKNSVLNYLPEYEQLFRSAGY